MTDTEEMSGKEDDYIGTSDYVIDTLPTIDGGFTRNSEYLLPLHSKRVDTQFDPITETEDINKIGSGVRRRKTTKTRNATKKSRSYREPKATEHCPITDTEDLDMDDAYCGKKFEHSTFIPLMAPLNDDGITDVESLSGDEGLDAVEMGSNEIGSSEALSQESFFSTVTSRDISTRDSMKLQTVEIPIMRKMSPIPDKSCFTCTDTEEMQIISDSYDPYLECSSRIESVTPELHTILGESGRSTIYHKNVNRFDMSVEKHHIKGHKELQDVVTDVEYLDDDGNSNAQKDACNNESKKFLFPIFLLCF